MTARLHVEPLELVEQLVTAGLPQRQALGVLDEAVRLGERAEQVEIRRGGDEPVGRSKVEAVLLIEQNRALLRRKYRFQLGERCILSLPEKLCRSDGGVHENRRICLHLSIKLVQLILLHC